jgi:hypothetical protein
LAFYLDALLEAVQDAQLQSPWSNQIYDGHGVFLADPVQAVDKLGTRVGLEPVGHDDG